MADLSNQIVPAFILLPERVTFLIGWTCWDIGAVITYTSLYYTGRVIQSKSRQSFTILSFGHGEPVITESNVTHTSCREKNTFK